MAASHPIPDAVHNRAASGLAIAAALVTILLTGTAFWLSYEALHDLATGHHLEGARAWAWPATLDSFVIVGELLVLRASLLRRLDWFAMLLVASGSIGSIVLNVVSVGAQVDRITQVVAAIPPTAALLAFSALMRQIYRALAGVGPVDPKPRPRRSLWRREATPTADALLTAVSRAPKPLIPPPPSTPPSLPQIVYADPRAAVLRPLYDSGFRPSTSTMRASLTAAGHLGPDGTPLSDGTIRGSLRTQVELGEPWLAQLPPEPQARTAP